VDSRGEGGRGGGEGRREGRKEGEGRGGEGSASAHTPMSARTQKCIRADAGVRPCGCTMSTRTHVRVRADASVFYPK
jgi:hypothetical protein